MRITVVVCTRDRAAMLRETLESLSGVTIPPGVRCETLVIDNGSSDETPEVVSSSQGLGELRRVSEPRPGLSCARNRALGECVGGGADGRHYLLWIDDDVRLGPTWLEAYVSAFRAHAGAGVFGGPVIPELLGNPEPWLEEMAPELRHAWSAIDLGPPAPLGPGIDRVPYGANFVTRCDLVGTLRFDEALGRTPSGLGRGGEEVQFLCALLDRGHTGRWVPGAKVFHRIGPDRQTLAYLRRYHEADGFEAELRECGSPSRGRRLQLLGRAVSAGLVSRLGRLTGRRRAWVRSALRAADARGRLGAQRAMERP